MPQLGWNIRPMCWCLNEKRLSTAIAYVSGLGCTSARTDRPGKKRLTPLSANIRTVPSTLLDYPEIV